MRIEPCTACLGTWPPPDYRIADCGLTVAYLFEDQYFPGWTVLVLKRHATELFHLAASERSQLIEEVSTVSHALFEIFHPVKMNYELLGNQLPHIHWHVIPRLPGDPALREPVWRVSHEPIRLSQDEVLARTRRIRAMLDPAAPSGRQ